MPKGNEDLKAKITKIQQKGKQLPPMPTPEPEMEESDEASMEALEAEFEQKKQALMKKKKASPAEAEENAEGDDAGLETAIQEYSDEGKFRVEIVYQLVQLNKNMKEIADALKGLVNNEEE